MQEDSQEISTTSNTSSRSDRPKAIIPHSTVVFFHVDADGLYWTSARKSQHCQNFMELNSAFITLHEEDILEGLGVMKGLYLQGQVSVLSDKESILRAKTLSAEKANRDRMSRKKLEVPDPNDFMNDSCRAVYHFVPDRAWTNVWEPDETGVFCDSRKNLNLQKLFPVLSD